MTVPAIGHNQAPGAIGLAESTFEDGRQFLKDNPVIGNGDEAKACKALIDRAALAFKGIEEERKSKVDPLNKQVREINAEYHRLHNASNSRGLWDILRNHLKSRLTAYARRLEAERIVAAEAAHAAKEEAERIARQAEEREQQAATDAAAGVCDVDLGGAMAEADIAFAEFKRAGRVAQRAERDTKVRIGGGFGRVATLRDKEVLTVTDWKAAIEAIGLVDRIAAAIITEARTYRDNMGELPAGIAASYERSL